MKTKLLKKILGVGAAAYIMAYAGLGGYALLDSKHNSDINSDRAPRMSEYREFKFDINGKKKKLGIIGEYHGYNHNERKYAVSIIKQYDNVALEGSAQESKSKLFSEADSILSAVPAYFYTTGSCRRCPNAYLLAFFNGKKIMPLEENSALDNMNFGQKSAFLADDVKNILIAPYYYFDGKKEIEHPNINDSEKNSLYFYTNGDKREKEMSEKIVRKIKDEKTDNLLCFVGKSHLEGIISNIGKEIKLE